MSLCVNCGIGTDRCNTIGRRSLEDKAVLSIVQERIAPQAINETNFICEACWNFLNNASHPPSTPVGHRRVCILCGRSLLRRVRFHQLTTTSSEDRRIRNVINEWIMPRTVSAVSVVCHSCWTRANKASRHFHSGPSTSGSSSSVEHQDIQEPSAIQPHQPREPVQPLLVQPAQPLQLDHPPQPSQIAPPAPRLPSLAVATIILPDYFRAVETESRCFVEGCQRPERNRVTTSMRKQLLKMYNYYVPPNNRLCNFHISCSWEFLDGVSDNIINVFSATHIQDMLSLKDSDPNFLDFENIDSMEDYFCRHWTGFTKQQFQVILNEVPQFQFERRGATALAAYLIKLRTGDSDDRLSTLLQIPKTTLGTLINKARKLMYDYFVPHHLGLNHINKQNIINRNLLIPNGLFGIHNGEVKPIVILDGTYIYVQKSSNYMYQKQTYSLHKYRNLVKPFLIVCTDGYIIDVMGPYPATTSDADIVINEFRNGSPLREYFEPGDAFILDRGFRDALLLLNDCGYRTYVPASLQEGESQLSTLEANKSRSVTICRWVIEAVNGRFKRDFKLLRQQYFNKATKHLMVDFEIAAALINSFHSPVTNRDDAQEILQIIHQNMYLENRLSAYVNDNNLNRRRAQFEAIDVEINNVSDFPELSSSELILISLGTYQIKQARSYYGEHVRPNGTYAIEVCREVDSILQEELSTSEATWLLRGRIQSRHISNKTYFVYVLVDSSLNGRDSVKQYCCNCIVGKRTVGCCAHIMSIIWYLGWARFQENIAPPAQSLDSILIYYDSEGEDN